MFQHKPLHEIAGAETDWLKAKHHFAIGRFGNPAHRAVGNLYVLNDDEVAPHRGFGMHSHANVEIITYVRSGVISHRDSLGNTGRTNAGDIQVISAGSGIEHSEQNEGDSLVRLFQLWLKPRSTGGEPQWSTGSFRKADRAGRFIPLASGRGTIGALAINSDTELLGAVLANGTSATYSFQPNDSGYLVVSSGSIRIGDLEVKVGEAVTVQGVAALPVKALSDTELLLVVTASD